MPSLISLFNFIKLNSILLLLGHIQHYFYNSFLFIFIHLIINYILIFIIYYGTKNKQSINAAHSSKSILLDHYYIIFISLIESIIFMIIPNYIVNLKSPNYLLDLLLFTPVSLLIELIFDFFHYWTHRYFHINKKLYVKFHKSHHLITYTNIWSTFHQNPIDYICNNGIPMILAITIVNNIISISTYQYSLFLIYKIILEISGHCGKKIKAGSFIQNIWIAKMLNIQLRVEDHDLHHTRNNCNYSKRFSLWDKIFCTYSKLKEK